MYKILIVMLSVIVFCSGCSRNDNIAITIGDIEITKEEFENAFESSRFVSFGKAGRKSFLDKYIMERLILKEAEQLGLDKDPQFLHEIQIFWEKSLSSNVLTKKKNEFEGMIYIRENQIKDFYSKNKDTLYKGKELNEVFDTIKETLAKQEQEKAMRVWIESLKDKVEVYTNYTLLGIDKNKLK